MGGEAEMSVRRGAARLATVLALTVGTAALAAAPAYGQDERVRIDLPSKFAVGEKAGEVTVKVTKRTDGCVAVRTALAIRLPGVTPDQVGVQARIDDDWVTVPLWDNGDGLLLTEHTAPEEDELCKGKSRSVRYRMAFRAGAPAGVAHIVGEAYTAGGVLLGREAGAKQVGGRLAGTYQPGPPTPSPTPSPSAEPTPEPTVDGATAEPSDAPAVLSDQDLLAAAGTAGGPGGDDGSDVGTGVMAAGVGMVAVGIALLVLLIRRLRPARSAPVGTGGPGGSAGDGGATMLLPRIRR
ncbi:hypothetical protein [Micromonospora sp. LOL_015]|uniref:hypothetical protein n=1 Tax=Micromonospora sp. LOL_015 TaxID=3345416 RepID=UPI003A8621BD